MNIKFNLGEALQKETEQSQKDLQSKINGIKEILTNLKYSFQSPLDQGDLEQARTIYGRHKKITQFVHVGIGGSALGPQTLIESFANSSVEFFFFDNLDPEVGLRTIEKLQFENALFYFVSKSGNTTETLTNLMALYQYFVNEKNFSSRDFFDRCVVCTSEKKGTLASWAESHQIPTLGLPTALNGRFSIFSNVGLFPAMFAGIEVDTIPEVIHQFKTKLDNNTNDTWENLIDTALALFTGQKRFGLDQTVLMSYTDQLKCFGKWFVQLWGESLGKKYNHNRRPIHFGLTPIEARGSTDQHSLLQLLSEGPFNKVILFLGVKQWKNTLKLSTPDFDGPKFSSLKDLDSGAILHKLQSGTQKALAQDNRPSIFLELDQFNLRSFVELVLFFEYLTAIVGELAEINPFDQPGVELAKTLAFE